MMKLAFIKTTFTNVLIFIFVACQNESITIYPIKKSPNNFEQTAYFRVENMDILAVLNTWKGSVDLYNVTSKGLIFSSLKSSNNEFDQFNSFYIHNKDSIFCTKKYTSKVQLFDYKGKHLNTIEFKEKELNHFSNYRNQATFYKGKFYLTEIDTLGILNQKYVKEAILDLEQLEIKKIEIPFPPDYFKKVGLSYTMPSKILAKRQLVYLFPGSNYLGFFDLENLDFKYRKMNIDIPIEFSPFQGEILNHVDNYIFFNENSAFINLKYNTKSNLFLLSKKHLNKDQKTVIILDEQLNQQHYFEPELFFNKSIFEKDNGFYVMYANQYDTVKCVFQEIRR